MVVNIFGCPASVWFGGGLPLPPSPSYTHSPKHFSYSYEGSSSVRALNKGLWICLQYEMSNMGRCFLVDFMARYFFLFLLNWSAVHQRIHPELWHGLTAFGISSKSCVIFLGVFVWSREARRCRGKSSECANIFHKCMYLELCFIQSQTVLQCSLHPLGCNFSLKCTFKTFNTTCAKDALSIMHKGYHELMEMMHNWNFY